MIENLQKGIEVSKNLLDTLPKNNIKNKNKYDSILEETEKSYTAFLEKVESQIKKRYVKYTNIEDASLEETENKISLIKEKLYLLNPYNSSYEKINFDKILYRLNHFYKSDLTEANKNILDCIKIFERVGIKLRAEDFNYSPYAYEYMKVLLENPEDLEKVKETFEKNYWQCSNILIHIELNIKYLYYKNKSIFEKYAEKEKYEFIKLFSDSPLNSYNQLFIDYEKEKHAALKRGVSKFIKNEWNINDYQDIKVQKYYSFFTDLEVNDEINIEINKFSDSVKEYKMLLSFQYIIDDIKEKYLKKENKEKELKSINKEIQKKEKLVYKYNKKKKEKHNQKATLLIQELEVLYENLDETIFCDRLFKKLNDDSSIYDLLCLACSHYLYIVKCMKKNELKENFEIEHQRLIEFLLNPHNNIILNISITEEKDIALIISDRYKLSNFNITKDTLLEEQSRDEIIETAKKIDIYNKIVSKLSYDNLKFVVQVAQMLKK